MKIIEVSKRRLGWRKTMNKIIFLLKPRMKRPEEGDLQAALQHEHTKQTFSSAMSLLLIATTWVLGLFGGSILPGAEFALDWKNGKQEAMGNGLHYILKIKGR